MIHYTNYIYIILICLFITLVSELIMALILGLRKKDLINVILVNLLTNPLLNSIVPYMYINYGEKAQNITFIVLEIIVFALEGFIYSKVLKNKEINGYLISCILNFISVSLGLVLTFIYSKHCLLVN